MSTVVIGSGIIGISTAYFLSQESGLQADIHLVEANPELFASASGYAAGFLARDWFSPSLSSLGALSYDLHKQLAQEHDGQENWGYSRSSSTILGEDNVDEDFDWRGDGQSRASTTKPQLSREAAGPAWLVGSHANLDIMSSDDTTAQIDPLRLCRFLLSSCLSKSVRLHHPAKAVSIRRDSLGGLSSIIISYENSAEVAIPCTDLVLAAGAWTPKVFSSLFPSSSLKIPISSLAGHSVLLRSPLWPPAAFPHPSQTHGTSNEPSNPTDLMCHAIFTSDPADYSPEIFSRLPGHVYLAGLNSSTYPLPALPAERVIDEASIATLMATAQRLMGNGLDVLKEAVCWRPISAKGTSYLGKVPGEQGVWIAAGHGKWGISLSLGTGKVMAEMLLGKKTSADVSQLNL